MPVDHKRINGPEESVPYQLFARHNSKNLEEYFEEVCSNKIRSDKRNFGDHRKIFIKTGIVSQAKGSSYVEVGNTKVIISVFDPREIPNRTDYSLKGELYCDFKFAPFSCPKRRLHQQDNEEKQYSCIMKKALESSVCLHELPNFQIDIFALVLHNDGSALSAAINGAGVALAQAGVPMYDVISSVTLGIRHDKIFVDPNLVEQDVCQSHKFTTNYSNHGIIIVSRLHTQQQVCQFYHSGYITLKDIQETLEMSESLCEDIVLLVQKCIVQNVAKAIKL